MKGKSKNMEFDNHIESIITVDTDKCIGCNKCIKVCPIKVANTTSLKEGTTDKFVTTVNQDKCINCGECVKVCTHGARSYNDHSQKFFEMFENGEPINIIVAPSIKTAFPNETWKHVLEYFKNTNSNIKIYDVSFGADICTWGYNDYLKHNKGSKLISQPCPAIVNYIEKYQPKLLMKLSSVHSPASCLAIYLKKYHNYDNSTPIVLFSPCIAKTSEAIRYNTFNYNVTFDNLKKYFIKKGLNFENQGISNFEFNAHVGGLGQLYPRPGGLKDNLLALQPDLVIRTFEGPHNVYKRLERYVTVSEDKRPDVLDVLNCQHGCNQGTANIGNSLADVESYMDELEIDVQKSRSGFLYKYRDKTYKQFDKVFNPSDFRCIYNNKYEMTRLPSENDIDNIFNSMLKTTKESRSIDCNSCGYDSCHEMACMIFQGYNVKDNCIYYMKNKLNQQLNKINDLHNTLENELQVLSDTSISLNNSIEKISSTSIKSNQTLKGLIADLNSMSAVVENFQEYFKDIDVNDVNSEDMDNVINLFEKLGNIFSDSFLSRLQSSMKNDEETINSIHELDVQSQKLSNMLLEISSKFENE